MFRTFCVLLLLIVLQSCSQKAVKSKHVLIALSKDNTAHTCQLWLKRYASNIDFIDMYKVSPDSINLILNKCNGIIITGGNDIQPALYGKANDSSRCEQFAPKRDTLDQLLINYAKTTHIPILGICRGAQIINVTYGGTLYTDIPSQIGTTVIHRSKDRIVYHDINILPNSLLHQISQATQVEVNSIHHQSIEKVANNLKAVAWSADGVIEAIEPQKSADFLLGVQWHPELLDSTSPVSKNIAMYFIQKVSEQQTPK